MAIKIANSLEDSPPITSVVAVKRAKKAKEASPAIIEGQPTKEQSKPVSDATNGNKRKGFASMTPDKLKEISAKGGSSLSKEKRYFAQNPDAARKAGAKGGLTNKRKGQGNAE